MPHAGPHLATNLPQMRQVNDLLIIPGHPPSPTIEAAMRKNWILTRAETVIFIAGVTLLAGGAVWASAVG
jgi:hypothetical protein